MFCGRVGVDRAPRWSSRAGRGGCHGGAAGWRCARRDGTGCSRSVVNGGSSALHLVVLAMPTVRRCALICHSIPVAEQGEDREHGHQDACESDPQPVRRRSDCAGRPRRPVAIRPGSTIGFRSVGRVRWWSRRTMQEPLHRSDAGLLARSLDRGELETCRSPMRGRSGTGAVVARSGHRIDDGERSGAGGRRPALTEDRLGASPAVVVRGSRTTVVVIDRGTGAGRGGQRGRRSLGAHRDGLDRAGRTFEPSISRTVRAQPGGDDQRWSRARPRPRSAPLPGCWASYSTVTCRSG